MVTLSSAVLILGETLLGSDGSFTASEECQLPEHLVDKIEVSAAYTRGAAGGCPLFRFKWKIAGSWRYDTEPTGAANVAGNTVSTPVAIAIVPGPVPADGSELGFVFTIRARARATALLVEVAEAADTAATPGTITTIHLAAEA